MHKRVILAFVLVLALLATSGCSLIIKDEAVDRATPVIEVAGKTITKGEIVDQVNYMMDYYESMYAYYGMSFDRTDAQTIADMRQSAIDAYISEAVITQKITEGGFDQLTEEETAELDKQVEEDYQLYYDSIELFYFTDSELEGEARKAAIEAEMTAQGYPTKEQLAESTKLTKAEEKLRASVVKDVMVSEEEFQTEFQTRADADKTTYTTTPGSYGTDVSNGTTPYYTPAGYRYVKHILISFTDEDNTAMEEIQTELSAATDETVKADLTAKLEAAKATAMANIQPTIDELAAKIAAGEDFNALITAYNSDPGMTAESTGYLVSADSTNWVESFTAGSMALEKVGDVSGAVESSYGVHFIKYESDVAEGVIDPETVRETITAELLTEKQDQAYSDAVNAWITEANPKVDTTVLE